MEFKVNHNMRTTIRYNCNLEGNEADKIFNRINNSTDHKVIMLHFQSKVKIFLDDNIPDHHYQIKQIRSYVFGKLISKKTPITKQMIRDAVLEEDFLNTRDLVNDVKVEENYIELDTLNSFTNQMSCWIIFEDNVHSFKLFRATICVPKLNNLSNIDGFIENISNTLKIRDLKVTSCKTTLKLVTTSWFFERFNPAKRGKILIAQLGDYLKKDFDQLIDDSDSDEEEDILRERVNEEFPTLMNGKKCFIYTFKVTAKNAAICIKKIFKEEILRQLKVSKKIVFKKTIHYTIELYNSGKIVIFVSCPYTEELKEELARKIEFLYDIVITNGIFTNYA